MRGAFDFETNRWNGPASQPPGSEIVPRDGLWIAPEPPKPPVPFHLKAVMATFMAVSIVATLVTGGALFPFIIFTGLISIVALSPPNDSKGVFMATDRDRQLLEDENDLEVCLAVVEIYVDRREIGRDRGIAWFSSDRLCFTGHRTSFAIGGQDILPFSHLPKWAIASSSVFEAIALNVPGKQVVIKVAPIHAGSAREPSEMRLVKHIYEFRRQRPVSPEPRQWPPLTK